MTVNRLTKKCPLCGFDNSPLEERCKECDRPFGPSQVKEFSPPRGSSSFRDELEGLGLLVLVTSLVCASALMGVGLFLQYQVVDVLTPDELRATEEARAQVLRELLSFSVDRPQIEFRKGGNLDVYLPQKAYESVPFPDRPLAVEAVGKRWCVSQSQIFFPEVRLRDERTGAVLSSYSCVFGELFARTR